MNWLKFVSYLLLPMVMAACAHFPGAESTAAQMPAHVRLEMHDVDYDGKALSGRLLISPVDGTLRLDKRLISSVSVRARSASDCTTGHPVEIVMVDLIPPPVRDADLLILDQGYWYGGAIRLPLFIEHMTGNGPECVDAELALFSFDGDFVATLRVHAIRKATPTADGGILGPPQPPKAGQHGLQTIR